MKGQVVWGWPGWSLLHDLPHGRKRTHRTPNTLSRSRGIHSAGDAENQPLCPVP